MNYRTTCDLARAVEGILPRLPRDVGCVVGVPRSGMLPSSMIALALNVPLADVAGFCEGRLLGSGTTRRHAGLDATASDVRKVLLVDDSTDTGGSMREAHAAIGRARPDVEVVRIAAYGTASGRTTVDIQIEVVAHPRVFQWNVMHHQVMGRSCLDMDGVLCVDPSDEENDDGPRYEEFLAGAAPLHIPRRRVAAVVTSRLERYRPQTERWLAAHGVEYGELVMLDLPDREARMRAGAHAPHKARAYAAMRAELFVESDPVQAADIARLSGRPVLCMSTQRMLLGDAMTLAGAAQVARTGLRGASARMSGLSHRLKQMTRTTLGDEAYDGLKRSLGRQRT